MSVLFTLTQSITPPPIDGLIVIRASDVNDTLKTITIELAALAGADQHPKTLYVTITNGSADCVVSNPHPTFADVLLIEHRTSDTHPELVTAWDTVMGAYFTAGGTVGMLGAMAQLGIIPAGSLPA